MKIRCKFPDKYVVTGIPSHKEYIFSSENNHEINISNTEFLEEDIKDILSKTRTMGCCGNPKVIVPIFELIE